MFDKRTLDNDEGVSPVIGVILMVAITVILAAVIGTFVLDLAGGLSQDAQASVTFDEDSTNTSVTVQLVSMQNADSVDLSADDGDTDGVWTGSLGSVGASATMDYSTHNGTSGTITAVGVLDGNESVLQTYDYG